uniref:Uncharacterized protein n=1 Tax=Picea glauca TaxID=3330 RepID=A0A124GMJ5_PICGL|nr:hypothetical protein ABT39_MTgene2230 [Picea glauca]
MIDCSEDASVFVTNSTGSASMGTGPCLSLNIIYMETNQKSFLFFQRGILYS